MTDGDISGKNEVLIIAALLIKFDKSGNTVSGLKKQSYSQNLQLSITKGK
jgi:hypothetical protein